MATKAALYHRVSRIDQNPENAREELRRAASARGLEVVLDIEETGSGAKNNRPGLQEVLSWARRGKLDAVLVWKLDRWGRSTLDVLANVRALTDAGVRFVCTTQGLDIKGTGDAMGNLILGVMAAMAEFERSLIVERTMLGLAKARAAGKRPGPKAAPNGPTVQQIATLRAGGKSWTQVAAELGCSIGMARHRAGTEAR
jgi:putative DNA-invertase from lambdoid prophage Rac